MAVPLSKSLKRLLLSGDHHHHSRLDRSISTTASAAMRYHILMADRDNDKGPVPSVKIRDANDSFTVTRDFPGFGKEIMKVAVKNAVSIQLWGCGDCETLVPLPEGCKTEEATSVVKHGRVTVVVPKKKKGD